MQTLSLLHLDFRKSMRTDRPFHFGSHLLLFIITGTALWLPLSIYFFWLSPMIPLFAIPASAQIALFILGAFTFGLWSHVVVFLLIQRYELQRERKVQLFTDLAFFAKEVAQVNGKQPSEFSELYKKIYSLEIFPAEYARHLPERNAALWTFLNWLTLGLASYFFAFMLMTSMQRQQDLEEDFLFILSEVLIELKLLRYPLPLEYRIVRREFSVYALLSIFSLGLFWYFWYYALMHDFNRLLDRSERWEGVLHYILLLYPERLSR